MRKKVLVFGTFDLFHPGHSFFLEEARKLGELWIVTARDSTVERVKGRKPVRNEKERLEDVRASGLADNLLLGGEGDKYNIIEEIRPDMIFLGYDQTHFTENLSDELKWRGIRAKIIRCKKSFRPDVYKSSKLRKV